MKLKNMLKKVMLGCVNAMAMMLVVQTANSACVWIVHQPEFPEVAKRYSVSNDQCDIALYEVCLQSVYLK